MPKPFFKDDFQLLYKLSPNTDLREIKEHYFRLNYFFESIEKNIFMQYYNNPTSKG